MIRWVLKHPHKNIQRVGKIYVQRIKRLQKRHLAKTEIHKGKKSAGIPTTGPFGEKYKVVAFWHYLFDFSLYPVIFQLR